MTTDIARLPDDELDARLAENPMGYGVTVRADGVARVIHPETGEPWSPTRSPADSAELKAKMREKGWRWFASGNEDGKTYFVFAKKDGVMYGEMDDTELRAIAGAAWRAMAAG